MDIGSQRLRACAALRSFFLQANVDMVDITPIPPETKVVPPRGD